MYHKGISKGLAIGYWMFINMSGVLTFIILELRRVALDKEKKAIVLENAVNLWLRKKNVKLHRSVIRVNVAS